MYADLEGKSVVVTGAGKGIGRQIALAFAREGAKVICADVDFDTARRTAEETNGVATKVDVRDESSVEAMFRATGVVDVLVNNAGIYPSSLLVDMEASDWDHVFAVNVRGVYLCTRAAANLMLRQGKQGSIVCISSGAGEGARIGAAHYCASKAAVNMLVKVAAIELGPRGIRVNGVAPGLIREEIAWAPAPSDDEYFKAELDNIPLRRTGTPGDVARAVLWLASHQAEWVTGHILHVTGGAYIGRTHLPLARRAQSMR